MIALPKQREARPRCRLGLAIGVAAAVVALPSPARSQNQQLSPQPIVHKVQAPNERLELIVNSSRILTLDKKMPQAQVGNPDILELTPLSATQVQVFAKKAGVTQVNLWDEDNQIHAIDVMVIGDARELQMILQSQFPSTALKVTPLANSVVVSGHVDNPNQISRIVAIAEDYYPKVINNITVAGVQQVKLRVKVLEVSRTKLRALGADWRLNIGDDFVQQSVSGLLSAVGAATGSVATTANETLSFGIVDGSNSFFGFLEALEQSDVAKIVAEPELVTYSGRPASFIVGGEFPILVPQSLGTVSILFKKFGTEIDFVPIVLGNGVIRLEVRPRVSEIDDTRAVRTQGLDVPGLKLREANTGVEMRAGQTFALAGLVQTKTDSQSRGLPWVKDLPWVGAAFRKNKDKYNEVELLILVTPELVEPMDPEQVPCGGPGLDTMNPNDVQLYWRGHIEVPYCPADGACAPSRAPFTLDEHPMRPGMIGPAGDDELPPMYGEEVVAGDGESLAPTPAPDDSARSPRRRPRAAASEAQASDGGLLLAPAAPAAPLRKNPRNRTSTASRPTVEAAPPPPGFIGPVGYDVER